jgi:hypothetical protein
MSTPEYQGRGRVRLSALILSKARSFSIAVNGRRLGITDSSTDIQTSVIKGKADPLILSEDRARMSILVQLESSRTTSQQPSVVIDLLSSTHTEVSVFTGTFRKNCNLKFVGEGVGIDR